VAYQYKNADTRQFEAAVEKSSGQDLKWFFDEWFYRPAFPDFTVVQTFVPDKHELTLDISQNNHDRRPFRMPVVVQAYTEQGVKAEHITVDATHQIATITGVAAAPKMVLFDPDNNLIRKLQFHKSVAELHYQATHAPAVGDRLWAVDQLSNVRKTDRQAAREAVRDVIAHDPFYGVRVDALDASTTLGDSKGVLVALHDGDARVVIGAAAAAADLKSLSPGLIGTLRGLAGSTNPQIAGAALHGLGASKRAWVYPLLVRGLDRRSFREWIARGAESGLASFGDLRALPLLEQHAAYGRDDSERPDAIAAIGRLAKKHPERVRAFFTNIARTDPFFRARRAAVVALGKLRDRQAIPALWSVEKNDSEPGVRNAAWDAIADSRDAARRRGRP